MAAVPQISDAEWQVMKAVWEAEAAGQADALTAGEIARRVGESSDWQPRTIKTLLGRLVRKGAVAMTEAADERGKRFLYRSAVSREACRRQETRSFLHRVFDGAVTPAVVHFLKQTKLSDREIAELRQVLEQQTRSAR